MGELIEVLKSQKNHHVMGDKKRSTEVSRIKLRRPAAEVTAVVGVRTLVVACRHSGGRGTSAPAR